MLFGILRKKTKLKKAFEYVRDTFFPKWDKNHHWKVRLNRLMPSGGRADPDTKAIVLSALPDDIDSLYMILIHEICHAVTQSGHTKKWTNRMINARDKAQELGLIILSNMLSEEINIYNDPSNVTNLSAQNVYERIRSFVLVAVLESKSHSYKKVIKNVAHSFGLYPEELEQLFIKCREVYKKALEEAKKTKREW